MVLKIILIGVFILILLFCFVILSCRIYAKYVYFDHKIKSPGIDSSETIEIGDIKQCIYIRGRHKDNPVVLYLHGGPGFPMMFGIQAFQYDWENNFTVVQWDQRLSGKTFFANCPEQVLATMNFQRSVQDVLEVVQYIRKKLNKNKVIIMGHSWGTVLGTAFVQMYPELVSAYIATGQAVNMRQTFYYQIEEIISKAKRSNNQRDISELTTIQKQINQPFGEDFIKVISEFQKYLEKYKLDKGVEFKAMIGMFTSPYYSLKDLSYFFKDATKWQYELLKYLFDEYDIRQFGVEYNLPIFYIMGENDATTPATLAKAFFDEIQAPYKKFILLPCAAHNAMLENKREYSLSLKEIIPYLEFTNHITDK